MTHKLPPQQPGAPGWKAVGVFSVASLAAGIGIAIGPAEGGRILTPYLDSANIPTACTGIIGPEVTRRFRLKLKFTEAECVLMEAAYISKMTTVMKGCVPARVQQEMAYGEWITYGHWSYNTGVGSFCQSTLGRKLAAGDHAGACMEMARWTWSGGKNCRIRASKCSGIPTRRDNEVAWCLGALQ